MPARGELLILAFGYWLSFSDVIGERLPLNKALAPLAEWGARYLKETQSARLRTVKK